MATTTEQILQKIHVLENMVRVKADTDEVLLWTVSKLVNYETEKLKLDLDRIKGKLGRFEERYSLDSAGFYQNFRAGELGDETDFFEWAALHEMYSDISAQVEKTEVVG